MSRTQAKAAPAEKVPEQTQAQAQAPPDAPQYPTNITVKIHSVRSDGPTLANASVDLNGVFAIRGVKIMQGKNGPFVSMPSYKAGNEYKNGVASSKPLPLGRYKIVESQAADFYGLDTTPIDVEIEHAGQIVKAAMTNKSLYTNVSIKKTGYVEVMPGQSIRYDFSGIANNSTTSLTSFYWRDTLPAEVRLNKIVTGTYNVTGNYKIVYRTNLSGENYRVLV